MESENEDSTLISSRIGSGNINKNMVVGNNE